MSNILKICIMAHNANSSFIFDQGYSYLVQQLPMVCWWQVTFQIINVALESKANVNFTQNM